MRAPNPIFIYSFGGIAFLFLFHLIQAHLAPILLSSPCLNRPLGRPLFQAGQVKSKAVNLTVAPG